MLFAGFSIVKLLSGFALWRGANFGKLLYNLAIIAICLGVFWKLFIAPSNVKHETQQAETITNITQVKEESGSSWFSLRVWGLKLEI